MNLIDFHTHVFPEKIAVKAARSISDFYSFQPEKAVAPTIDVLKQHMAESNTKYAVTCSTATVPEQVQSINSWIAELKDESVLPLGTLHPDFDDIEQEVERIIKLGLYGIKLHPDFQRFASDSEKAQRIYRAIEGRLMLLIHAGDNRYDFTHPRQIANVHEMFPRLTIIAAHLGGYSQWDEASEYLIGADVYIDTSSAITFLPPEKSTQIILNHGTDKVLFGTDFPLTTQKQELELFNKLYLNEQQREDILFNNGYKLLFG